MLKKMIARSLCLSLFFVSSAFAPSLFAADVETVGDLKVDGEIWSTSGGFKFPDGTTLITSGLSGLLFNIGFVVDNSNSNTGNLNSGAIKFGTGATGEGIASQRTSGDGQNGLDFYTNSTSRLFIDNSGKVGIGTRTPTAQLHVLSSDMTQAQFGATPLYLQNADAGATSMLGFNLYWDGSKYVYGSSHAGAMILGSNYGLVMAVAAPGTAGGSPVGNYPKFVMRLTSDGKVRIGDSNTPAEALDVLGNIKASGTITGTLAANSVNSAAITDGSVTATKLANGAVTSTKIWVDGDVSLNHNDLKLLYGDTLHGLGWYGADKLFAGANVDGPALYGYSGGALGSTNGGQKIALSWDSSGNVSVPTKLSAGPGLTGTPLAYGVVNSDGTCTYKSANVTCVAGSTGYYYITIAGEDYDPARYVTLVTLAYNTTQIVPIVDTVGVSPNHQLAIGLKTSGGTSVSNRFYFVTFKP